MKENMPNFIRELQAINVSRANRWHGGDFKNWSGLEWAGAMCGEAGEAANVAKKLRRVELAIDGNAFSERKLSTFDLQNQLGGECADTFLYLLLLCARYDIDLQAAIVQKFNVKSEEMGFPEYIDPEHDVDVAAEWAAAAGDVEASRIDNEGRNALDQRYE
jgi:NTP pyrophosphatase (non-canonical NTP hydrolase)